MFQQEVFMEQGNRRPRTQALVLAVWFGLLTGFGEVSLLGLKKFYLGRVIRFGPHIVWMTPLADALIFLIPGLILFAIARRRPERYSPKAANLVFAFLGFLSVLLMYYPLHLYAKMLLAAGLAAQAVQMIARWPHGFQSLVRRSGPWMVALVAVLAIGVGMWRWIGFQRILAQLSPAPPNAPNVLLIVLDTVRAQNLSLYGYNRPTTPNLERWAKSGVVFDRATSTAPWTLPSHASMFTGRWPHELSADLEKPLDRNDLTLAEALSTHGYLTAGFVANTYYCGYEFGLSRGFAHYEDYVVSPQELLIDSSLARSVANSSSIRRVLGYYDNIPRKNAATLTDHFLAWVTRTEHRPFFVFLNYFDAHETYLPPVPFAGQFGPDLPRGNEHGMQDLRRTLRNDWNKRPPEEIKIEMDMYDGAIAYLDYHLDRLFGELRRRSLLENTIVVVTSDHGEQFGEHGLFLHGNSLYEPLLHVPLMISYPPRVPGGQRVAARVSLRDLPETILDLIGLHDRKVFPGNSLARYWSGRLTSGGHAADPVLSEVRYADWDKDWYPTAKGDMQSLMDDRYHYIRNGDGREELYALDDDPPEQHDLSHSGESVQLLESFRKELRARME
jgi:arylsulfatase A-like enzyme